MSTSPYITDVTGTDFETAVVSRSRTTPVLVDFWASWCAPCKMLMPVLARLAEEYQGKVHLAKVDTDREQDLAARYGVRSLPTVKLFKNGVVVDEFLGVQPEQVIRNMISRHAFRPSDTLRIEAHRAIESGEKRLANDILRRALDIDPGNDQIRLDLSGLLLDDGRVAEAGQVLDGLSPTARSGPEAEAQRARLEIAQLAADSPAPEELEQLIAAKPEDNEARYRLSAHRVLQGNYDSALALQLDIVRRDRRFRDDGARKAMLTIFTLLGGKGELVKHYRTQLSLALN